MPSSEDSPRFTGTHFFVRDMNAALKFYALLGLTPSRAGVHFAHIDLPDGQFLEFGTHALTKAYDPSWTAPAGGGTNALQFALPSRGAVDGLFARMTDAGYVGRLRPFDAFWGSRYAEVRDPDGNVLGFQSPADDARRGPPPEV